jgi:2-C-methyl-D-erythritol 4-phosphate cytidylyltransferase
MEPNDLPPSCSAVFVAAGNSRRMGFDKLAAPLGGLSVLVHAMRAFENAAAISELIVVCPVERCDLLEGVEFSKPVRRVDGGPERQDSVAAGLAAVTTPWVAVHDAARPLVCTADIDRCVAMAQRHGAASLARRVTETMQRADDGDFTTAAIPREGLWIIETPQIFETSLLRRACAEVAARRLRVTDETSAAQAIGARVKLVESSGPNWKITTPADLALAEALMR